MTNPENPNKNENQELSADNLYESFIDKRKHKINYPLAMINIANRLKKPLAILTIASAAGVVGYVAGGAKTSDAETAADLHEVCADAMDDNDMMTKYSCGSLYRDFAEDNGEFTAWDLRIESTALRASAEDLDQSLPFAIGGVLLGGLLGYSVVASDPGHRKS